MASSENYVERAQKIGLPLAKLAREAGLHVQTVTQMGTPRRRGPFAQSLGKVRDVVVGHEVEVLDHLLPLHLESRIDEISDLLASYGYRLERVAA